MNIKILDSWLRESLQTKASAQDIAKNLSLTSVSIEKVEPWKQDWVYDIEVTTNRPDLASVNGLAREASAALPQQGIQADYKPLVIAKLQSNKESLSKTEMVKLAIDNDPKLVNRLCAVVMEVHMGESPEAIKERLEASDIRSLNNIIDVTNYVMRMTGQPTHVMDYDRVGANLKIREAKKGEKITTLDGKTYILAGGDIVAENEKGEIIDLLGIMGLQNSVVTNDTKRILFFINNVHAAKVRKTSMEHGIRTEAVQLNEKHLDPQLCEQALAYGIQLYQKLAHGKITSEIIDIYPNQPQAKQVTVLQSKVKSLIGVAISDKQIVDILTRLGFGVLQKNETFIVTIPSFRLHDVALPEDILEEIARMYGYHNLPNALPDVQTQTPQSTTNQFYWENNIKHTLKDWGFTEVYTYSFVSEHLYEGPLEKAVTVANPLNEDMTYLRRTLVPSLLQVVSENKQTDSLKIFEIANVYHKRDKGLPDEIPTLAGVIKQPNLSFFVVKGYIEQLLKNLGIQTYQFKPSKQGGDGAEVYIEKTHIGNIELLDSTTIDFECNFQTICSYANNRKIYILPAKYPPIFEDITLKISQKIATGDIVEEIQKQSKLIVKVNLLDRYEDSRTFHITYQDPTQNLTSEEVKKIHDKIATSLQRKWQAKEK